MTTTTLSPAKIERDPALGRSATVTCEAECVFGHATIVCRYADVGFSGEWLLADLQVDVKPELVEPPYPATDDGADQLARRFVYAFQNSDFATVNALVPNTSDAEKLASFRESLIGDGLVTVLKRSSIETREINGANVRAAAYDIETSRERRAGTVTFYVVDADGQWRVLGVETSMRFAR